MKTEYFTVLNQLKATRKGNFNNKLRNTNGFITLSAQIQRWISGSLPTTEYEEGEQTFEQRTAFVENYLGFHIEIAYQYKAVRTPTPSPAWNRFGYIFDGTAPGFVRAFILEDTDNPFAQIWVREGDAEYTEHEGRLYYGALIRYDANGTSYLCSEFERRFFECRGCGVTASNESAIAYGAQRYCRDCAVRLRRANERVYEGTMYGYHEVARNWTIFGDDNAEIPLGIELEMYMENNREVALIEYAKLIGKHGFFERDGSLCEVHGVEVVYHPMTLSYADAFFRPVLAALTTKGHPAKGLGYDAPNGSYGIHISVARKALSCMQEVKMQAFMYDPDNKMFLQAIAQREVIYGGGARSMGAGMSLHALQNGMRVDMLTGHKKYGSYGKYSCVNLKEHLMEIRIFQSTLHPRSFMKNLEFVDALVRFTSTEAAQGWHNSHRDMLRWLTVEHQWARYPNLLGYLRKEGFNIKRQPRVINTWLDLLPRENVRVEPMIRLEAA